MKCLCIMLALLTLGACSLSEERPELLWGDISAPELLAEDVDTAGLMTLEFSEEVELDPQSLRSTSGEKPAIIVGNGKQVVIDTKPGTRAGKPYKVAVSAKDKAGNTTSMIVPLYGPNPRLPKVQINELITVSSTKVYDLVELLVLEDGDLAGLTVALGTAENYDALYQFAPTEVKAGDYIVVHCKQSIGLGQDDERLDWSSATAIDALPGVWDVWFAESPGLPDASGVVSLLRNAGGAYIDAVFYTDKSTEADKDYDSFGTKKLFERVKTLAKEAAWAFAAEKPAVEDGVPSKGATSTRSIGRRPDNGDTNASTDWQIAASGNASPGRPNSPLAYVP